MINIIKAITEIRMKISGNLLKLLLTLIFARKWKTIDNFNQTTNREIEKSFRLSFCFIRLIFPIPSIENRLFSLVSRSIFEFNVPYFSVSPPYFSFNNETFSKSLPDSFIKFTCTTSNSLVSCVCVCVLSETLTGERQFEYCFIKSHNSTWVCVFSSP